MKIIPVVAIDPGKHAGIAWFDRGQLVACALVDPDRLELPVTVPFEARLCVVELPCHQRGDTPDRTNDLFKTAFRGGVLSQFFGGLKTKTVSPHAWKGNVPKELHNERVLKKLSANERLAVYQACTQDGKRVAVSLLNNVIDAVGLGLWEIGR